MQNKHKINYFCYNDAFNKFETKIKPVKFNYGYFDWVQTPLKKFIEYSFDEIMWRWIGFHIQWSSKSCMKSYLLIHFFKEKKYPSLAKKNFCFDLVFHFNVNWDLMILNAKKKERDFCALKHWRGNESVLCCVHPNQ